MILANGNAQPVVLASRSAARAAMLTGAGVPFTVEPVGVDEEMIRDSMMADRAPPRAIADALAEMKAVRGSQRRAGALVIGSDQIIAPDDRTILSKPADRAAAEEQLLLLAGRSHKLISAVVVAEGGRPVWRHVDTATVAVRDLSAAFVARYLDLMGARALASVGCYEVEGLGMQLFSRVEGDHFTIRGMPLLPLLQFLRLRGVLPA